MIADGLTEIARAVDVFDSVFDANVHGAGGRLFEAFDFIIGLEEDVEGDCRIIGFDANEGLGGFVDGERIGDGLRLDTALSALLLLPLCAGMGILRAFFCWHIEHTAEGLFSL